MQCLEGGKRAGHERGAGRRERTEPDPAAMAGGQRGEGVLGVLDRGEHAGRVLAEQQCGVCRSHPPAHPLEEPDAGLSLERAHLLAHSRGRVAQERRGSRHRTGLHDGLKGLQTTDVDHGTIKPY